MGVFFILLFVGCIIDWYKKCDGVEVYEFDVDLGV